MTQNEIKKKYNSKITVKEVRPYEILITGFDENNSFDRKVVAKTCKLSNKGYHVVIDKNSDPARDNRKKVVIDDENATVKVTGYDLNDPKDNRKLVLLREVLIEEKMYYTIYVNGVIA